MKIFILVFFCLVSVVHSQTLEGVLYDNESTIEGAKIFNKGSLVTTYSGNKGDFNISAKPNDTILITSYFHKPQEFLVQAKHFETKIVIELKKIINQLDVVDVYKLNEKNFKEETIEKTTDSQLKEDIKNNPHLYGTSSEYGLDFIRLGALIAKMFKKNKKIDTSYPIGYKDYQNLFKNNPLFSETLLIVDFQIPKQHKELFIEYCESKKFDSKLLKENQHMILLDSLYKASLEFNKLLDTNLQND